MATFNEFGLQTRDYATIRSDLVAGYQAIYGYDLDLSSDTPAGQQIDLLALTIEDNEAFFAWIVASRDPDQAIGTALDSICKLIPIYRKAGSYTIQQIRIVITAPVSLSGLDSLADDPNGTGFTVSSTDGNRYILLDSEIFATAGTYDRSFRAEKIGAISSQINTITNIATFVVGVESVNNIVVPTSIGSSQESDLQLRQRRDLSVAIKAKSFFDSIYGNVAQVAGVQSVTLLENDSNTIDSLGVPAHGIWLIVNGGANTDIALAIANNKTIGADMRGSVVIPIEKIDGTTVEIKFDRPASKVLYVRFEIQPFATGATFDLPALKAYITSNVNYQISKPAETATLTNLALDNLITQGKKGIPINLEISKDNMNWVDYLEVDLANEQWSLSDNNIAITVL